MPFRQPRFILAGGGTGGHLFPALAIAGELKRLRPECELLFVGAAGKIEARIVPAQGYRFVTIWISGFHRTFRPANFLFPLRVVVSLVQAFFLIMKFKPDAVVGTGGYVAGPVLWAASVLRRPTFIHESNSYPGVTTKLLARRATRVFIGFEEAKRWLPEGSRVELVGTPARAEIFSANRAEAIRYFGLRADEPVVLVTGGSLGAGSINKTLLAVVDELIRRNIQVVWQTGSVHAGTVRASLGDRKVGWVDAFIDRMDLAYAAADVVVCRAGATTVAELTALGKPAILVPYPHASGDHQTHNARTLADAAAAILLTDRELAHGLKDALLELLGNKEKRRAMAAASKSLGRPHAGRVVAEQILAAIHL